MVKSRLRASPRGARGLFLGMTIRQFAAPARQYALIGATLLAAMFVSPAIDLLRAHQLFDVVEHGRTLVILFEIVMMFALGFLVYELAKPTVIPSFVLAIFFGMIVRESLSSLTLNPTLLTTLITIGAVFILFSGGLETPFQKFQELLAPILSLAIVGTVLNAMLLSLTAVWLLMWFNIQLPIIAIVLLGAALASTDPAAIIPSFQSLVFTKPRLKHIAVSESAINDVVGAVLVSLFLTMYTAGDSIQSVLRAYTQLVSFEQVMMIGYVVLIGVIAGGLGFAILHFWSYWKQRVYTEGETDAALFLAVPLAVFTAASLMGGSGYLGVFVTGLFFSLGSHMRHVEHYFNHTIEAFMKPMIFILLGALVDPAQLVEYAPVGIIAGLLFMFVLRPLVVFATLMPFCYMGQCFSIRELLFLSFVRETGVIPAALLVTIKLAGVPGADTMGAIGLWIILLTVIIEPPLTPLVARTLGVAKDLPSRPHRKHAGPVAVLCSRGYSFPERMRTVVDWAKQHGVENIALLHCPEEKYSPEFVDGVRKRAEQLFRQFNQELNAEGHRDMTFEFLCGPGLLQDNIESLIAEGDVSIIFVGSKMLDYRMEDVKRLSVPFYFM